MTEKIICIGFNKTGTASIKMAMKILKYKICPLANWYKNENARKKFSEGNYEYYFELIRNSEFDFYKDYPFSFGDFYKKIDEECRDINIKYILTTRNPSKWYTSKVKWSKQENVKYEMNKNYSIENAFYKKPYTEENREFYIEMYNKRLNEMIEYFKGKDNLLIIDIDMSDKEKWRLLCNFLGKEIPQQTFPHTNKQDYSK